MEIRKASVQGFCFGVAITVKKAEEAVASGAEVTTLGHVVHNPQMVAKLKKIRAYATPIRLTRLTRGRCSSALTVCRSPSMRQRNRRA